VWILGQDWMLEIELAADVGKGWNAGYLGNKAVSFRCGFDIGSCGATIVDCSKVPIHYPPVCKVISRVFRP
jgi:hypothetical protein